MAELTDRAFNIALHERGPVQINIPRDYFYGEIDAVIRTPKTIERNAAGPRAFEQAADMLALPRSSR